MPSLRLFTLFFDGNGRLGRLLITFLLCAKGVIREFPILYLSLYLKANRAAYYELLDRVRAKGDWGSLARGFFLTGVKEDVRSGRQRRSTKL